MIINEIEHHIKRKIQIEMLRKQTFWSGHKTLGFRFGRRWLMSRSE